MALSVGPQSEAEGNGKGAAPEIPGGAGDGLVGGHIKNCGLGIGLAGSEDSDNVEAGSKKKSERSMMSTSNTALPERRRKNGKSSAYLVGRAMARKSL